LETSLFRSFGRREREVRLSLWREVRRGETQVGWRDCQSNHKKGYEIKTWSENGKRYWKMELFPAMKCGGTHVKNSSEIGEIQVKRGKKPGKGKERIEISLLP